MEGYTLLRTLREVLNESENGDFMNDRTSYDYLYYAIQDFNYRTHYLTASQTISVIAGQTDYPLNPDFIQLALLDIYNRAYIKHTYNGSDTFIHSRDYASIVIEDNASSTPVADGFAISDADQPDNVLGTATVTAIAPQGEANLTDAAADFTNVRAGDFIHNTTDGSDGVVIKTVSKTQIKCALFEGTNNFFSIGDNYVIVPQPTYKLTLTPIPSAVATLTVVYTKKPDPVYSPYGAYKLPFSYMLPIVQFAAFLYKYRDREANYGDAFFKYYDGFARKVAQELRRGIPEHSGMRANFIKINSRSNPRNQRH